MGAPQMLKGWQRRAWSICFGFWICFLCFSSFILTWRSSVNESDLKITWRSSVNVSIYTVTLSTSLLFFIQLKAEVAKEVANARRKQHLSSLQYYCALNALQYRKRVAMMEPMLGYTRGQVLTVKCLYHLDMFLGKPKHCSSGFILRTDKLQWGWGGNNLYSACLDSSRFCLWQIAECLDIQERH